MCVCEREREREYIYIYIYIYEECICARMCLYIPFDDCANIFC